MYIALDDFVRIPHLGTAIKEIGYSYRFYCYESFLEIGNVCANLLFLGNLDEVHSHNQVHESNAHTFEYDCPFS
jgi:hypothetical protein